MSTHWNCLTKAISISIHKVCSGAKNDKNIQNNHFKLSPYPELCLIKRKVFIIAQFNSYFNNERFIKGMKT